MLYRNVKTGATVDVTSKISSDIWEPVEKQTPSSFAVEKTEKKKEEVAPVQQKTRKKKTVE